MKKVREIMRPGFVHAVQRHSSVAEAVRVMAAQNVGIVAILDGERLVGVCSERDVVQKVVDRGLDAAATPVARVMTSQLVVANSDDDCASAMRAMDSANIRHLPVVSGDRLLSMLSIRDLMRAELDERGQEIRYLTEYLYQVGPSST
jgi:CBS domain-containing protein